MELELWNEIETVMDQLITEGETEDVKMVDAFFFQENGTSSLPLRLEKFRQELQDSFGDYEFLWSDTHLIV